MAKRFHMVTGAFGYTGKYIARRLLSEGETVKSLTGHAESNTFSSRVQAFPYDFDKPDRLKKNLEEAKVLYNTYWIRFPRGKMTYEKAVRNTAALLEAAAEAQVERLVHISISNPCEAPHLPYFQGKCKVEKLVKQSGLSYAILRPAVIFGREDILINNIAYLLRTVPAFGVIGFGGYRIRPIYVDDLAKLAVEFAKQSENRVINAIGPESFTFKQLLRLIKNKVDSKALLVPMPARLAFLASRIIGLGVRDVLLTWDEVEGLTAGLLDVDDAPVGETRLSRWLEENADTVGRKYSSELARHYR
ncbi:MAG: NAD-dependent epimerase/dehydratase family protein [Candidatus Abyssobacteria bacterium SURF_5]|uniref:NAD-dependent epimerase/dehydratase family protein n=1 Tax=Abyssobacteria bacterium (strain SURF_5) TaxID=2093360 RepID=A0A3A4NTG7_ABYX5|nr:MAG: NAD-dependent epimerase/dehydratase family protein [Candidatus Abyssubacteria bacterium SURF_5]